MQIICNIALFKCSKCSFSFLTLLVDGFDVRAYVNMNQAYKILHHVALPNCLVERMAKSIARSGHRKYIKSVHYPNSRPAIWLNAHTQQPYTEYIYVRPYIFYFCLFFTRKRIEKAFTHFILLRKSIKNVFASTKLRTNNPLKKLYWALAMWSLPVAQIFQVYQWLFSVKIIMSSTLNFFSFQWTSNGNI